MKIVGIDPGVRYYAYAGYDTCTQSYIFDWVQVDLENIPSVPRPMFDFGCIEGQSLFKGRTNGKEVIGLAFMSGYCSTLFTGRVIRSVQPREHKGGIPKKAYTERVLKRMPPAARAALEAALDRNGHNVGPRGGLPMEYHDYTHAFSLFEWYIEHTK